MAFYDIVLKLQTLEQNIVVHSVVEFMELSLKPGIHSFVLTEPVGS